MTNKIDPHCPVRKGVAPPKRRGGEFNSIFLWIPRTGGHTVEEVLRPHGLVLSKRSDKRRGTTQEKRTKGFYTFKHGTLDRIIRNDHASKYFVDTSFIFTFVRNPWDRIISAACHEWKRYGQAKGVKDTYEMFDIIVQDLDKHQSGCGLRGPWRCRPQATWLYHGGRKCCHYIGRHEHLQADLATLCRILGLEAPSSLPHASNRKMYRGSRPYYTDHTRAIVAHYERRLLELVPYTYQGS